MNVDTRTVLFWGITFTYVVGFVATVTGLWFMAPASGVPASQDVGYIDGYVGSVTADSNEIFPPDPPQFDTGEDSDGVLTPPTVDPTTVNVIIGVLMMVLSTILMREHNQNDDWFADSVLD